MRLALRMLSMAVLASFAFAFAAQGEPRARVLFDDVTNQYLPSPTTKDAPAPEPPSPETVPPASPPQKGSANAGSQGAPTGGAAPSASAEGRSGPQNPSTASGRGGPGGTSASAGSGGTNPGSASLPAMDVGMKLEGGNTSPSSPGSGEQAAAAEGASTSGPSVGAIGGPSKTNVSARKAKDVTGEAHSEPSERAPKEATK